MRNRVYFRVRNYRKSFSEIDFQDSSKSFRNFGYFAPSKYDCSNFLSPRENLDFLGIYPYGVYPINDFKKDKRSKCILDKIDEKIEGTLFNLIVGINYLSQQ